MDSGDTGINVILIVVIVLFLVLSVFIRRRRAGGSLLGRVISIFAAVNHNEKLVGNFGFHRGVGKLKTSAWEKNKDRVDFLPQELRMTLSQVFEMSEEVNERIDAAR